MNKILTKGGKKGISNFFQRLFASASLTAKPKAVAFVDFEHWYISLDRFYHTRPDLKEWLNELSKTYDVRDIYVFADFSNQSLRAEIPKIREVTSSIIETQNASSFVTKDFTDFIMLDHIYQKALSARDIKAFIIFSGDGHFSSVASFLKNRCGKTVGVYGVRTAMSSQLRNTATWCIEIPSADKAVDENQKYYDMIFGNLKYLADNNRGDRKMYPTFWGTVDAVSSYYNTDRDAVTEAMRHLIERDYIFQTDEKLDARRTIKVINVNWELAKREGVYTPGDTAKPTAAEIKKVEAAAQSVKLEPSDREPARRPASRPQPKAEAKPQVKAEPKAEPKPQVKAEPKTEAKPQVKAEPKTEPKPQVKAEPKAEPKPQVKAEPKTEAKPQVKAEPKTEPKPQVKAEPKAEAKPQAKAEAVPQTGTEAKPQPKPRPRKQPSAASKSEPKAEAKPQTESEAATQPKAEPKPQRKAVPQPAEAEEKSAAQDIQDVQDVQDEQTAGEASPVKRKRRRRGGYYKNKSKNGGQTDGGDKSGENNTAGDTAPQNPVG